MKIILIYSIIYVKNQSVLYKKNLFFKSQKMRNRIKKNKTKTKKKRMKMKNKK